MKKQNIKPIKWLNLEKILEPYQRHEKY